MAGLIPATHADQRLAADSVKPRLAPYAWMDGTSPSMTALGCVFYCVKRALHEHRPQANPQRPNHVMAGWPPSPAGRVAGMTQCVDRAHSLAPMQSHGLRRFAGGAARGPQSALRTACFQPAFFADAAALCAAMRRISQARHGGEGRHPRQAASALPAVGPGLRRDDAGAGIARVPAHSLAPMQSHGLRRFAGGAARGP